MIILTDVNLYFKEIVSVLYNADLNFKSAFCGEAVKNLKWQNLPVIHQVILLR